LQKLQPKKRGEAGQSDPSNRVRHACETIIRSSLGANPPNPMRLVCVAWYQDGGKEELTLESFQLLSKHKTWLVQLSALQAYVKPKHIRTGEFSLKLLLDDRDRPKVSLNPALDALTKKLCQFIEVGVKCFLEILLLL
jgi:hypothetical protein